ncbi:hypothetical protein ACHAW5_004940 [Stephanodiscus triporus]|uniref:Uncharacterized protein n=1 Tax=Stephanodiscus triporus TaxID=2934178 RepID=A0ABD3NBW9_9STRA
MKASSSSAATALAALYAKDAPFLERSFDHLTPCALRELDRRLLQESSSDDSSSRMARAKIVDGTHHSILARACIRRKAHRCLHKYASASKYPPAEVEDALKFHDLPSELRERLASSTHDGGVASPPTNWHEELERLKKTSDGDRGGLWRLVCDHPMTSYVPVQCRACGRVVPDQYPAERSDAEVGLEETPPTGEELELRSGWFRGPRGAVVFRVTCPDCARVTQWYRSGHPRIMLNPNRHGRLCGEQEDLRLILAGYLNVSVRMVVPLDWDHVWSEYNESSSSASSSSASSSSASSAWQVHDGDARNFCRRLDEGIGSWTGVWAIHPDPDLCEDVTPNYLTCRRDGGRADDVYEDDDNMKRYEDAVRAAREDPNAKRRGGGGEAKEREH